MGGTLPGVECARRRRFRASSVWSDSSLLVNSAFGSTRSRLAYNIHLRSNSFLQRSMANWSDQDGKLGGVARKAKERLDERLRGNWKSEINSQERSRDASIVEEIGRKPTAAMVGGDLQIEVFGLKKSVSRRFNWAKIGLNWKSFDQEECAVCLDKFKIGEKLTRLPCAHRFHSMCLLPWLESHTHCPCCRSGVLGLN